MQENYTENSDEKNECASSHLIYGHGRIKKPDIHQLDKRLERRQLRWSANSTGLIEKADEGDGPLCRLSRMQQVTIEGALCILEGAET